MTRFSFAIPLVRVNCLVFLLSCVLLLFLSCVFIDVLLRRNNKRINDTHWLRYRQDGTVENKLQYRQDGTFILRLWDRQDGNVEIIHST